jgi:hypothetical protein
MTTTFPFICLGCTRFHNEYNAMPNTCDAFPDGIPAEISSGLSDHKDPWEGDHGLQFEENPEKSFLVEAYYDWINSPEGEGYKLMIQDFINAGPPAEEAP